MESSGKPNELAPGSYYRAFNAVVRGGRLQCRPGYKWRLNLPEGKLQGLHLFRPTSGAEQLVFVVAGLVYTSVAPFDTYAVVRGIQLDPNAEQVWWADCERAVQRNPDLSLTLVDPRSVLIIQDGVSAPASWDGSVGQHLRGRYATPQGTAMLWSGGRLWVARGRSLFASDYADPFTFFEGQYIGITNSFILPGNVRAMAEVPNVQAPRLLVFTDSTTTAFLSGLREREQWPVTENFQTDILPDVGCASQRSIVKMQGQLYWFGSQGLTRLDVARQGYVQGLRLVLDTPMAVSKYRLDPDTTLVAGVAHESYLLMSVPHASRFNTHTWCLDLSNETPTWASYWTGTQPVEWATGAVLNEPRCFYVSKDLDGVNRLWEAFSTERLDNGCPITWGFVTRAYGGAKDTRPKIWRNGEITFDDLTGEVDVAVYSAGSRRGRFKRIGSKRISVAEGSIGFTEFLDATEDIYAFRSQSRTLQTEDDRLTDADPLSSCCLDPDVDRAENIDTDFQLCVLVNGPGSVDRIRVWFDNETEHFTANCPADEEPHKAERFDGGAACGTNPDSVKTALDETKVIFTAIASVTETYNGVTVVGTGYGTSSISQACADKLAQLAAQMRAAQLLIEQAPPKLGGFLSACLSSS